MKIVNSLIIVTLFFLASVTVVGTYIYQQKSTLRAQNLSKLSDDNWCRQKILERFPDYPLITFLGNVTKLTQTALDQGRGDAWEVYNVAGPQTEYYRVFGISKRAEDPNNWDSSIFDSGFITSDLNIYEVIPWGIPPGP